LRKKKLNSTGLDGIKFLDEKLSLTIHVPKYDGPLFTSLIPNENPNKLFIGGLPSEMVEEQVFIFILKLKR
jgi:hypothetical protein